MPLTDAEIRRAAPKPKPWKLFDAGGLHLLINPNGSKLWRLKYRHRGKELQAAFGPYPAITLREARQTRDDFRRTLVRRRSDGTEARSNLRRCCARIYREASEAP